ncbi:MAG: GNAT family N-acetyltransferase [Lachnospiraceae bacterium]|nr:GNAT family N-acetyltransferase [Lachnospiraceae bacterium]
MIKLRKLQKKDAPLMLEWMHDVDIQKCFKKNMLNISLFEAQDFCENSNIIPPQKSGESLHFAIVNEEDEYLGTVSLKDVDLENLSAEYAIATRKIAHGKGVGSTATALVLEKAFNDLGLHRVYLNVLSNNIPAIRLYEKSGFKFEGEFREHIRQDGEYLNWKWYGILANEFNDLKKQKNYK